MKITENSRSDRRFSRCLAAFVALLLFPFIAGNVAAGESPASSAQFLLFSDLHLEVAEARSGFPKYGEDSTALLIQSALADARRQCPHPLFILITGDFLDHQYPRTAEMAWAAEEKIVGWFAREFPGTTVFPTLGNNDSLQRHYEGQSAEFLRGFAVRWQPLITNATDAASFLVSFPTNGCYRAGLPGLSGRQLLALNISYKPETNANGVVPQPGTEPVQWAAAEVAAAGERSDFWLAYHVPPGLDFFKPNKKGGYRGLWQPDFQKELLRLTVNPAIKATFAGHTHMDEFRVIYQAAQPAGFIHIIPTISPLHTNDPAYQICSVTSAGEITDCETHRLANLESLTNSTAAGEAQWVTEYSFRTDFGQPRYDAAGLHAAREMMRTNGPVQERFIRHFASSRTNESSVTAANFPKYWPLLGLTNAPSR